MFFQGQVYLPFYGWRLRPWSHNLSVGCLSKKFRILPAAAAYISIHDLLKAEALTDVHAWWQAPYAISGPHPYHRHIQSASPTSTLLQFASPHAYNRGTTEINNLSLQHPLRKADQKKEHTLLEFIFESSHCCSTAHPQIHNCSLALVLEVGIVCGSLDRCIIPPPSEESTKWERRTRRHQLSCLCNHQH